MQRIKYIFIACIPLFLYAQGGLEQQTGSRNYVIHHAASLSGNSIQRIIDQLESDYQEFRYYFNLTVSGRTPVVIHNDQFAFQNATLAHRWETGTVHNEEIHLAALDYIRENSTVSSVLTQQVVRLVLYSRRMNGCPRWLYEGAAAYFAGIHELQTPPSHIPVRLPSDIDEILINPHNERAFTDGIYLSALAFKSILERYGEVHTVTLLRLFNGEFEYEEAVPYSLGVTLEQFEQQWQHDLQRLLTEFQERRER